MLTGQFAKHRKKRGFYMIGILIVVVIIMILTWNQLAPDPNTGVSTPQQQIDRGEAAACTANRQTMKTHIATWKINHPNENLSIENMKKSGTTIPKCPGGGVITIDSNGNVYCSIHAPQSDGTSSNKAAQPGAATLQNEVMSVMDTLNE